MTQPTPDAPLDALAQRFVRFADQECGDYAPLYDRLARGIARDPELLTIAAHARSGQQAPNLLLAAVHYLLLRGTDHALAAFYPSVAPLAAVPPGDPVPAFRAFCRDHRAALIELVSAGLVQTNEPQRCTVLLPAFTTVARLAGGTPLALIEVGASAGLNLLFDRYGYDYGAGRSAGDPEAPVRFTCELRGAVLPPIPAGMPPVAARVGIDLNPIHAADPQAMRWLRALVWPEHPERAALLQQVLALAQREPPALIAGDALTALPQAVAEAPTDATLCVFHIATLAHFPPEARERFRALIPALAGQRDLFWLSSEGVGLGERRHRGEYLTVLTAFQHGRRAERQLAYSHPHGAWLEWLDREGHAVRPVCAHETPGVGERHCQRSVVTVPLGGHHQSRPACAKRDPAADSRLPVACAGAEPLDRPRAPGNGKTSRCDAGGAMQAAEARFR